MYWRGDKTRGEISSISKSSLIFRKNSTFPMSFAILRGVIEVTFFEKMATRGCFHNFLLCSVTTYTKVIKMTISCQDIFDFLQSWMIGHSQVIYLLSGTENEQNMQHYKRSIII